MAPSVTVEVSDFGPIASGTVELRPLSIFVGPSNSGKTYLAKLLYALSETLGGFPRCPRTRSFRGLSSADRNSGGSTDGEWRALANKLTTSASSIRFDDLPERIRTRARAALPSLVTDKDGLPLELRRCFDIDRVSEVVRSQTDVANNARISVSARDGEKPLWWFELGIPDETTMLQDTPQAVTRKQGFNGSNTALKFHGQLEDPDLMVPNIGTVEGDRFSSIRNCTPTASEEEDCNDISKAIEHILLYNSAGGRAHYLPATRSGIMQSYRIIASSLLLRTTRVGGERFPELPTFSGIVADFMEKLIWNNGQDKNHNPRSWQNHYSRDWLQKSKDIERGIVAGIAAELELKLLDGRIQTRDEADNICPDFVYVPNQSNLRLPISQSSSMVSELAPIILFLREIVASGDMLIIEEPEAHLHPVDQIQMALALAKLARTGVRVVVTTHSNWMLNQIGNLIRQGEVESVLGSEGTSGFEAGSLSVRDVGVWLFQKIGSTNGPTIKEVPYDRVDGIYPTEFARVDEELYNRSADLQNVLEHGEKGETII